MMYQVYEMVRELRGRETEVTARPLLKVQAGSAIAALRVAIKKFPTIRTSLATGGLYE
jgi:hypothetical protein